MSDTPTLLQLDTLDDAPDVQAVALLARAGTAPHPIRNRYDDVVGYVVHQADGSAHEFLQLSEADDTERLPDRIRAHRHFDHPDSFVDYFHTYAQPVSAIYADTDQTRFVALIDEHAPDRASLTTHTATLQLRPSPEWDHWRLHDGALLDQVTFAEHIEDRIDTIVDPQGAEMLELAQHLEGTRAVAFKSGQRLADGRIQFRYDENIETTAPGFATIPTSFTLAIPIFDGTDPYKISCRLRYRLGDGGRLKLGYKIDQPDTLIRHALQSIAGLIAEQTGRQIWWGRPAR